MPEDDIDEVAQPESQPESAPPEQPVGDPVLASEIEIRKDERDAQCARILDGLKEVLGATELEAARKVIYNRG